MKKMILSLLVFSLNAYSVTLSQYRTASEGQSFQKFSLTKEKAQFEKRSNFFDKKKDFSLGLFSTENNKEVAKIREDLDKTLKTIKTTDAVLKTKGSSFNDLSGKAHHQSILILDGYNITQKSDLYPALKENYDKLQALQWKQQSGIVLSSDFKKVDVLQNGKVQKTEKFDFAFRCQKDKAPTVCGYKNLGIIYVE